MSESPSPSSSATAARPRRIIPTAPYPPMSHRNPSTQLKSSLSSKPQYSSGASTPIADGSSMADLSESDSKSKSFLHCVAKFCHPSLIAVINPAAGASLPSSPSSSPRDVTGVATMTTTSTTAALLTSRPTSRKLGPVLLEIQKLQWNPTSSSLYTLQTIARSRGNPSLGTSVASTCVDVWHGGNTGDAVLSMTNTNDVPGYFIQPLATGLSTGALCVHNFPSDFDWSNSTDDGATSSSAAATTTEYYHTGRHHRPATAVAWRPNSNAHQVAISWAAHTMGSASGGGSTTHASKRGVSVGSQRSSQPHDRDFGCFIWDLQSHSTKVPLRRFGHQVGATDVGWIRNGDLLVLGSQMRNFQVFDIRSDQPASQPMTVHAQPSSVYVRPDPFKSHQFATFSRGAAEPVKIWDARRIDQSVGEIKWSTTFHTNDAVSEVQWSPLYEGQLTVAVRDTMYDYDTSSSRPLQVGMVSTAQSVKRFCLYPYERPHESATESTSTNTPTAATGSIPVVPRVDELYHIRAIVCYADRTVQDVAKHRIAPVGISKRDGRMVKALGRDLWIGNTATGPAAMESLEIRPDEDISSTMMRRARCQHVARYSMDTASNIKLLSEDGLVAEGNKEASPTRESLLRLWTWVDRMESLFAEDDGSWPALSLVEAGASLLLRKIPGDETVHFSETLSCSVYVSPSRRAALTSCGWAGKFDLSNVLSECEALGEFERSAALAVWHGELGAGVHALQRGAASLRSTKPNYAETLELVALCVAGFRGGSDPSLGIWRQACSNLMERSELSGVNRSVSRVAYMRGLLKFLMNTGGGHKQVLEDDNLSLCDRVGFACKFLGLDELQTFLDFCIEKCQEQGNIEGLTITGIDRTGVKILQAYVDRFSDVQTAALVTSRVILPAAWEQEKWICVEWLDSYRSLLNTWQMWQSRAMFDVDRSELMRTLQAREAIHNKTVNVRAQAANRRFLMAVPFQMEARCTYCQQSLSLKQNNTNTNQWLREMNKSVLSCCASCRSPLPRCAICMLSLGALNPFLELQARAGRSPGGRQSSDDLTTASNLPFAEWFSWCMRCKHGGHAHHMVGWFASHDICPVSGCNCRCQLDGIQKLNRPALSKSNNAPN